MNQLEIVSETLQNQRQGHRRLAAQKTTVTFLHRMNKRWKVSIPPSLKNIQMTEPARQDNTKRFKKQVFELGKRQVQNISRGRVAVMYEIKGALK